MAAVHDRILPVAASNDPRSRRTGSAAWPQRIAAALVAVACEASGLAIAGAYPIAPLALVAAVVAWTVLAFVRFSWAWPAMLALMPVTGFATLTGWLTFEEMDLFVLATGAGGYAALALRPSLQASHASHASRGERRHRPALSILSWVLVALFLASTVIALERGFASAGGFRFDWLQGYDDPLNSLRLFKPFAAALLMTPLVLNELRRPGGLDRFGLGMTAALGLGALAVLQERYAFTGLFDFSSDYRVTAPFWEMHTGGAALDGFLALTLPFAIREALREVDRTSTATRDLGRLRVAAAGGVLLLAVYACLVTFSRGVYAAVPLSLLLATVLVYRQRQGAGSPALWKVLGGGAVFAVVVAAAAFVVFRAGGYRAALAVLIVLALALPVESSLRRTRPAAWLTAAIAAGLLAAVGALSSSVLPKGPYVVFAIASLAAAGCAIVTERSTAPFRRIDLALLATWLWATIAAGGVAGHWGGPAALRDSAAVLGALVALSFAVVPLRQPIWPVARRRRLAVVGFVALLTAAVTVFSAGAYMGSRFQSTEGDLGIRTAHWREGIGRLHGSDWLFGKGLGRFPATSQFESPGAAAPGTYRLVHRDGQTFVALSTPRKRYIGFDELFRFSQRVSVKPATSYRVTVEARSRLANSLHLELCEKQLLYHVDCVAGDPQVAAAPSAAGLASGPWQRIEFVLSTGRIGGSTWYAPKPVWFAIAAYNADTLLEIRSVEMIGPDGVDVVANGHFANGTAHWFSSSDRWHLPYHIKNILLDVLFDQGAIGLGLFVLLVGAAWLRTALGRARRHPDAPYVAAALVGYLVVGATDSLLDVPRVAFVFYVVVLIGLMLRNPRVATTTRTATSIAPAASVASVATPLEVEDAAAARARRRQNAFGKRGPG